MFNHNFSNMKKIIIPIFLIATVGQSYAQTNPAITSWLQNTTQTGSYYVSGNSTAIDNGILVNCQLVEYSANFAYVHTQGVPSYPTGPFLDGNPSVASAQSRILKMPLNPVENTGTPTPTSAGNIGAFINGVALFDYRDGVAWNPNTGALCGGPGNPMCPGGPGATMAWNRDAIQAERGGFDCSKGHPAMGNYHHHQNPSAFDLDQTIISTICNLYDAEGLYSINPNEHSPLLGFAYDGFPIYGAFGYANADGSGGIARMRSSYELQNMTTRLNGPAVNATYFLGYFREDYQYVAHPGEDVYLDDHNGRFCITPEYPNGIYAYFCTVDENWNSAYPYAVGPTFFGTYANRAVTSVTEATTVYDASTVSVADIELADDDFKVFPNPASAILAVQAVGLVNQNIPVSLFDMQGKLVSEGKISQGSTIWYLDTKSLYDGEYIIRIGLKGITKRVTITH